MTNESAKPVSIWTWVGLVLLVYGVIIAGTGVYYAATELPKTVLGNLNPSLWWGALMAVSGGVFLVVGKRAN